MCLLGIFVQGVLWSSDGGFGRTTSGENLFQRGRALDVYRALWATDRTVDDWFEGKPVRRAAPSEEEAAGTEAGDAEPAVTAEEPPATADQLREGCG